MTSAGFDPAQKLWVQAIDVDRMAALMCYIQLSLWNVPAEVIVGNTLSLEIREVWYTPAHHMGLWKYRLLRNEQSLEVRASDPVPPDKPPEPEVVATSLAPTETPAIKPTQLGFDF